MLGKDDKEAITKAGEELSTEMQKIGEIMQKAAQEEASSEKTEGAETSETDIRDAEVTEEEPKKDEWTNER